MTLYSPLYRHNYTGMQYQSTSCLTFPSNEGEAWGRAIYPPPLRLRALLKSPTVKVLCCQPWDSSQRLFGQGLSPQNHTPSPIQPEAAELDQAIAVSKTECPSTPVWLIPEPLIICGVYNPPKFPNIQSGLVTPLCT